MARGCELCESVAALYCAADKAHICWTCDAKVHSANFLVARHSRSVLCTTCATPTPWKASGPNPTPILTGKLCANCATQGESQGECATQNDDDDIATLSSSRRAAASAAAGRSVSSGCSSSNPSPTTAAAATAAAAAAVEDIVVCDPSCVDSASQLYSSTVVTVDTSVSLRISGCHPKRLAPGAVAQIATRALQDVDRSVAYGQCECTDRREAHDTTTCEEAIDCSRSVLGYTAKRMDEMRPSTFLPLVSSSRLMRMLAKWHWDLHLSSPGTVPLAWRMYRKVSRALAPAVLSNAGLRVTLAACLRLAAGLDEAQVAVPKASEVAACAGVSMRRLAMTEIHLLALLGWRRFPMWAGVRT